MDRRDFLKTTSTLVASGAISKNAVAEAFSFAAETPSARLVLPLIKPPPFRTAPATEPAPTAVGLFR